ncbi:hypothetical protein MACH09_07430 [Vibrio sp. MACH09]|nr:hypothetical protein MACH09_07430 [Vibrio sp. MACH09]
MSCDLPLAKNTKKHYANDSFVIVYTMYDDFMTMCNKPQPGRISVFRVIHIELKLINRKASNRMNDR